MSVLGISGSMRKDGNTSLLVKAVLERCEQAGIKTEFISLAGKDIKPCLGCEKCKENDWCVIRNDDWDEIMKKSSIARSLSSVPPPIILTCAVT